jgi:hypothetical protein
MDAHELFPRVQKVASRVVAMFGEMDTEVRWVEGDAVLPGPRLVELRVVLMPSEPEGSDWGLDSDVLGAVIFEESAPTVVCPTVYIFFPNVLRTAGFHPNGKVSLMAPGGHQDISRVLSRVIVHDVVHAVTRRRSHAVDGLMRSNLSATYLMRRRTPGLDARTKADFHAGLAALRSRQQRTLGIRGKLLRAEGVP